MSRAARLGAFIVVTLAILVAGVFIIGSKQYLFSSTYQVKAQFDNVAGLDAGGDVRVGGVHSGTVHSILLPHKPGDKVTVLIDLSKSTHEIIKQDSVATIETEGLLGNQYLAISFGSAASPDVRDGDVLASQQPLEMTDLLKKASGILDSSQQAIQNTTLATANLNSISAKIDRGDGTVGALVNDRQLYNDLEQTTGTMRDTMIQAQTGVTDFQENMEALKHNFLLRGYFKSRGYEDSADVGKDEIEGMPQGEPIKKFTYSSKQLFDKQDSAKLKNQKSLHDGGEFLANNQFGYAVVVVSAGKEGDAQKEMQLTKARAMVVREYLVENFGFNDTQLKTLGTGKQPDTTSDDDWGTVEIFIYPPGAEIQHGKQAQAVSSSTQAPGSSVSVANAAAVQK
jgi:phospholipid/cholesterol/gamma-HCH transport system substrate-binding protein